MAGWSHSEQNGKPGHCLLAQVWDEDGNTLACVEPTENEEVASERARLLSAAPDLLAALRTARQYVVGTIHLTADIEAIDAALAKAGARS